MASRSSVACKRETPVELQRRIGAEIALTPIERRVLSFCQSAAAEGRQLEPVETIMKAIGAQSYSTVPGIMRRLEQKGYITRTVYQRGRTVCIAATGQCTLPPSNLAPHWRFRTDNVQTPAIQQLRQKMPDAATLIEQEARRLGKHMTDFLGDLVYIGWHAYEAEKEALDG